ncbi:MAG: VRR-NUC domain-containing protein [Bacteroidales bacterium]|nr:VRR-NUC domain-containing protein [Bacteroidales bacterium]
MKTNDLELFILSKTAGKTAAKRPAPARAPKRHPESELQRICVQYFRLHYPKHALMLFAVPNGGGRSRIEAAIMKAEGITAGVSDLILLEARGGWGALCIEMKWRSKDSRQSKSQKEWQAATEAAGNRYEVCRSFEEFKSVVDDFMSLPLMSKGRATLRSEDLAESMGPV